MRLSRGSVCLVGDGAEEVAPQPRERERRRFAAAQSGRLLLERQPLRGQDDDERRRHEHGQRRQHERTNGKA